MSNTLVQRALVAGIWAVLLGRYAVWLIVCGGAMLFFAGICAATWQNIALRRRVLLLPLAFVAHAVGFLVLLGLDALSKSDAWGDRASSILDAYACLCLAEAITGALFLIAHRHVFGFPAGATSYIAMLAVAVVASGCFLLPGLAAEELARSGLIPIDLSGVCVLAWFVGTSLILKCTAPAADDESSEQGPSAPPPPASATP